MQSILNKHCDQTTADSFAPSIGGRLSLWFPTKQPQHSLPNSAETETEYNFSHVKLSVSQDSSSTLSSGQSNLEAATSAKSDFHAQNISFQPGIFETRKKKGEDYVRPFLSDGNADYISHQVEMEHHNQSLDYVSYPFAGSYFGKISSAYEPNAVVYPQMMGVPPTRVVLPLDCTDGIVPVYVNAKQYHAILRRRQTRAKLEARNKITKSRKSRHLHALKRVRGSGGRFVNTKNVQKPKISLSERAIQHSASNHSWGASTTSGSDASCIFNNDDIFPQPDLGVSIDSLTAPDNRLALSIDGYARISTAT
ncbi:nuclear transcription factor y subunit a-3 [Phtheirospermum japonicum]|uniref:Nuclear transcription factor Y subunit n=1 Tax=Phtheirospermum japonicum TaxID=374723 RepID=A0A830C7V5_9LAMI|nr:nuclear transcription factor y subunit a-3 [Phtheirospermum japonicum]